MTVCKTNVIIYRFRYRFYIIYYIYVNHKDAPSGIQMNYQMDDNVHTYTVGTLKQRSFQEGGSLLSRIEAAKLGRCFEKLEIV